jgi:hypothetical protein
MYIIQWFCYLWTLLSISSIVFLVGFAYWAEHENKKHSENVRKMLSSPEED